MPEISVVLIVAICAMAVIKICQFLYKEYQCVAIINKIPGPKAYPILGNILTFVRISREDRYRWFSALCSQYKGGIFRIWIGTKPSVQLTSAEAVSVVLSSKNLITKSELYDSLHLWIGTGLLSSTGEKWHRHRKLITPTFSFNILEQYAVVMVEKAEILKQCIASELENDPQNPIDMFVLMAKCALDVICESTMGININAQRDHNTEYSAALQKITIFTLERTVRPWLSNDWLYYQTSHGKRFKHTVKTAQNFMNQVISERKLARSIQQKDPKIDFNVDKPKRQAFLDHLLDECDRENTPLTNDELRQEVYTFMAAGHDTTSVAMTWALFCIGNHPEVEEKIHQEQLLVFGDSTEPATFQQLNELKYLERVIKESLRLFPSVPSVARTASEDLEIAGYKITKGTTINMILHQVHRDPKHWPDPDKFNPDRFLPENSRGRHPYAYVPFSAGPRNCIGYKFALIEEKIVLNAVLRSWRVKSLVKYNEVRCYVDVILRPQDGMKIYFTRK